MSRGTVCRKCWNCENLNLGCRNVHCQGCTEDGVSVFVHCSDGSDRSVQLWLVASLLLDQHDQTLKGFVLLIAKD